MKQFFKKVKQSRKVKWIIRGGLIGLVLLGIWFDFALWRIASSAMTYQLPNLPNQADAIIVLGCGLGRDGKYGSCQLARTRAAVDLWKAGYAPYLIMTGGSTGRGIESHYLSEIAQQEGVPESAIVLEERSTSTVENLRYSQEILSERKWQSIILVSEPYHMYRARLQAADAGVTVAGWWPATQGVSWQQFTPRSLAMMRDSLALMSYESFGWLIYR